MCIQKCTCATNHRRSAFQSKKRLARARPPASVAYRQGWPDAPGGSEKPASFSTTNENHGQGGPGRSFALGRRPLSPASNWITENCTLQCLRSRETYPGKKKNSLTRMQRLACSQLVSRTTAKQPEIRSSSGLRVHRGGKRSRRQSSKSDNNLSIHSSALPAYQNARCSTGHLITSTSESSHTNSPPDVHLTAWVQIPPSVAYTNGAGTTVPFANLPW